MKHLADLPELTCALCGTSSRNRTVVAMGLVQWREPRNGRRWDALPTCCDREACRVRALALGEPWDVDDRQPRRAPAQPTEAEATW